MHLNNLVVKLGAVEAWTISNDRVFGHSFHIHDVQFKIVARTNGQVEEYEQGWKDTVYVPRASSVTFIAKFDDYASDTEPFMYHCHMANHEDGGLMGQFLVSKDPAAIRRDSSGRILLRARVDHPLTPELIQAAERQAQTPAPAFQGSDLSGRIITLASVTLTRPLVLFFIERDCPCSAEAAPFLNKIAEAYGDACSVVGVINADAQTAAVWAKQVGIHFPLIADPGLGIIQSFGARRSVYTTLVAPGGMIVKTYPGYSAEMLAEISGNIARISGVPLLSIPFDGAPKKLVSGCSFLQPYQTPSKFPPGSFN